MKLQQLRYFSTACRMRSLSRAAESLHVSQPSVSMAIRELEREYRRAAERGRAYGGPLPLEDLGLESAWAYQDIWPTVVLRQDCTVLQVTFHQSDGDARALSEWAALLADAIR